jgi:hypothetical protein
MDVVSGAIHYNELEVESATVPYAAFSTIKSTSVTYTNLNISGEARRCSSESSTIN